MCSCYRPDGVPVPLCNRDYVATLRLLQRFEPCKAAEAHSIQTNLKVKHVWNLISCAETIRFSLKPYYTHFPHLLQLHQLLSFSCFSIPNSMPSPSTYKKPLSIPDLTVMVDNCHN